MGGVGETILAGNAPKLIGDLPTSPQQPKEN